MTPYENSERNYVEPFMVIASDTGKDLEVIPKTSVQPFIAVIYFLIKFCSKLHKLFHLPIFFAFLNFPSSS